MFREVITARACCGRQTGRTALMYAADKGHIDAARLLVKSQADINLQDKVP